MSTLPQDYPERAYAAVLGKLIGVYLGRPFENWTYQRIIRELGPIEYYVHDRLDCPLVVTDDDIAGTFTFIRALEDHGARADLSSREIGETWLNYIVEQRSILWWGGNGNSTEHTAWLNLKRGIAAPMSGSIAANGRAVAEQIGAQIFIDGWAIVAPGDPKLAARLAEQAARVSHDGAAVDAAKLWAAMEAEAFVSADIEQSDRRRPRADSGLRARSRSLIADVRRWRAQYPDWRDARQAIEARYGYDKYPGNCHVVPNHALMIMALLYAPDDFARGADDRLHLGLGHRLQRGQCRLPDRRDARPRGDRGGPRLARARRRPHADFLRRRRRRDQRRGAGQRAARRPRARARRVCRRLRRPKDGAQFHFSPPGSVQGFHGRRRRSRAACHSQRSARAAPGRCRLHYIGLGAEPAAVLTPTFAPPEVSRMRTYELMATPLVYPGEIVRARVVADTRNADPVSVGLRALVYGANDALSPLDSAPVVLSPGAETVLTWRLPDTGGQPIQSIGLAFRSDGATTDGAILLDYLRWDGPPDVELRRPDEPGEFWRSAWVNAVGSLLDQLSAGISNLAGPRRRHDHPRRASMDRLPGGDGAYGSLG